MQRSWISWGKEIFIAVLVAVIIRAGVAEARVVPTPSMVPTVQPGDRLLVEKIAYRFTGPSRGDIIVFEPPFGLPASFLQKMTGMEDDYLKRVIGLPGDTLEVKNGQVLVNGQPLVEPYIQEAPQYVMQPVKVPEGKLFVLGDNRNNSNDSHAWGFLDVSAVHGRAVARFWPLNRVSALH